MTSIAIAARTVMGITIQTAALTQVDRSWLDFIDLDVSVRVTGVVAAGIVLGAVSIGGRSDAFRSSCINGANDE